MRRGALSLLAAALLLLPTAIGFATGGATDSPRMLFAAIACLLLAAAAIVAPRPLLPRPRGTVLALAGLALLAALTALSLAWTVSTAGALRQLTLAVGYLALAAAALLVFDPRDRAGGRHRAALVEPLLSLGALVVVGYGLLARLLPVYLPATVTPRAGGRLTQPLTYWNGMGLLAALGLVLALRIAADSRRPRAVRALLAAVAPILAVGVQLSYSRAALLAVVAGVLIVIVLEARRRAVAALIAVTVLALLGPLATIPFPVVRAHASAPGREGALALVALVAAAAIAAVLTWWRTGRPATSGNDDQPLPRAARTIAIVVLVATLAAPYVAAFVAGGDEGSRSFGASAERLTSAGSNRSAYWRVAVGELGRHPIAGAGAGSFESAWLQHRTIDEKVVNAHSLWLETGAELGILGLAALALLVAGAIVAARRAPPATATAIAVLVAWSVGAGVDWQWQMPAVTGVAAVALGMLLASEATADVPAPPEAGDPA